MTPPTDNQLAALRDEIRRAGGRVRLLRTSITAGLLLFLAGALLYDAARAHRAPYTLICVSMNLAILGVPAGLLIACARSPARDADLLIWPCLLITFTYTAGRDSCLPLVLIGVLTATGAYWPIHQLRVRRALRRLAPDQQIAVLGPLEHDACFQTRKLAGPLLAGVRSARPTEVAPAHAPSGRGDEASPAG